MKRVYGIPTDPSIRLSTDKDFVTVTWGKQSKLSHNDRNMFGYPSPSTLIHLRVKHEFDEEDFRYGNQAYNLERMRDFVLGEDGLFTRVKDLHLGPTLHRPLIKIASALGLEPEIQNTGPDFWFGFAGRYESNATSQDQRLLWVTHYLEEERRLSLTGETTNDLIIRDPIQRSALYEARRKLALEN